MQKFFFKRSGGQYPASIGGIHATALIVFGILFLAADSLNLLSTIPIWVLIILALLIYLPVYLTVAHASYLELNGSELSFYQNFKKVWALNINSAQSMRQYQPESASSNSYGLAVTADGQEFVAFRNRYRLKNYQKISQELKTINPNISAVLFVDYAWASPVFKKSV